MKKLRLFNIKSWVIPYLFCAGLYAQDCEIIYDVNFNNHGDSVYTVAKAKSDFNNRVKPYTASFYRGIPGPGAASNLIENTLQETRVVDGTLRAEYKKNDASGRSGGFLFDPYFTGVEEAYLEYSVKFGKDFVWASGGKLPGLGGSTIGTTSETIGKGKIPSGGKYDENGTGFSARLMWRRNREHTDDPYFILYSYFAKRQNGNVRKDGDYGDNYRLLNDLQSDKWYKIKQYIKLNTPGSDNGIVKMWIDGTQVFSNSKMNIRKSGQSNLKINALVMNTYRGGSRTDPVWHSPRTEYAYFDDFKVWTGCSTFPNGTSSNTAPQVSIRKPVNNSIHKIGDVITITANASDDDNNIQKVNFKINDDFFKTDSNSPYETTFTPTSVGTYKISAKVFDTEGLAVEKFVTITVADQSPSNQSPTVSFSSPSNNSSYELGDTIDISATATDPDNNLEKINFKINNDFFRTDPDAPYTATFTPTTVGTYQISAKAFDLGGLTDEKSITINVTEPAVSNSKPRVTLQSPVNDSTFVLGEAISLEASASDIDGNLEKVNFVIDDSFYTTHPNSPYKTDFTPIEVGTYKIAARAFDTDGLTDIQYATINIVKPVPENQAPVVNITAPTDSAIFELGKTIDLSSSATDADNNIEKINFKINEEFYHFSRNNPANTTFTPTAAGEYKIAARVFDSNGLFDEKFVTITVVKPAPVNSAPIVDLVTPIENTIFELGDTIAFEATAKDPDGNLRNINFKINDNFYKWVSSGNAKATFTPTEPGTYKIAARASDNDGLFDEKFVNITVVDPSLSNQDFFNNVVNDQIVLFPNPATDKIFIQGMSQELTYNIYDLSGKNIDKGQIEGANSPIDVSRYPKGVYFLKIQSNDISKTLTFVK